MVGVELVTADGFTPDADLASAVLNETRRRGLLIGKGGLHGNCLRVAPPLSITADEAAEGVQLIITAKRSNLICVQNFGLPKL